MSTYLSALAALVTWSVVTRLARFCVWRPTANRQAPAPPGEGEGGLMRARRRLTPTCAHCWRGVLWTVKGEGRCSYHLFLDPWIPPKRARLQVAIRGRRPASEVKANG